MNESYVFTEKLIPEIKINDYYWILNRPLSCTTVDLSNKELLKTYFHYLSSGQADIQIDWLVSPRTHNFFMFLMRESFH